MPVARGPRRKRRWTRRLLDGGTAPASPLPHQTQCHDGERRQHGAPSRIDATAAAAARASASLEPGRGRAGAGLPRAVGEVRLLLCYVAVVGGRAAGADAATRRAAGCSVAARSTGARRAAAADAAATGRQFAAAAGRQFAAASLTPAVAAVAAARRGGGGRRRSSAGVRRGGRGAPRVRRRPGVRCGAGGSGTVPGIGVRDTARRRRERRAGRTRLRRGGPNRRGDAAPVTADTRWLPV